jgi:hypothetical protein
MILYLRSPSLILGEHSTRLVHLSSHPRVLTMISIAQHGKYLDHIRDRATPSEWTLKAHQNSPMPSLVPRHVDISAFILINGPVVLT